MRFTRMYWVYKSYLFFVNKVWPSFVKILFWSSVSLCTRAAIQLRNDASCSNWTHTEVLNLISSVKFNDSCLLSLICLICFFPNCSETWPSVVCSWTFLFLLSFAVFVVCSKLECAFKENLVQQTILVN